MEYYNSSNFNVGWRTSGQSGHVCWTEMEIEGMYDLLVIKTCRFDSCLPTKLFSMLFEHLKLIPNTSEISSPLVNIPST